MLLEGEGEYQETNAAHETGRPVPCRMSYRYNMDLQPLGVVTGAGLGLALLAILRGHLTLVLALSDAWLVLALSTPVRHSGSGNGQALTLALGLVARYDHFGRAGVAEAIVPVGAVGIGGEPVRNSATVGQNGRVVDHAVVAAGTEGDLAASVVGGSDLTGRRGAAATIKSLDLGLDAAAVGGGADGRQVGTDGLNQAVLALRAGVLESSLYNIIGVVVTEDALNLARNQKLVDNHVARWLPRAPEALLDNVGAELVTRQAADLVPEHGHHRLSEGGLVKVDDVLHDVVAEGVLDKDGGMIGNLANEPDLLFAIGVVDAALKDTAAVAVRADLDTMVTDCVKDELRIHCAELVQTFLDNMVAIEILDEIDDPVAEGVDDHLDLDRSGNELDHLLEGASAVLVERDANHVLGSVLDEDGALFVIAEFKKLLAQIVAERICHELNDVGIGLQPDRVNLLRVALLKLLL